MDKKERMIKFSRFYSELHRECKFKGCVFPDISCTRISQAHSIQRNKILNHIATNGYVRSFDILKTLYTGDLEDIGIKKASSFFGFCNYHDTILFSEIENEDYKEKKEQNFLHAYRACAREFTAKWEATSVLQKLMTTSPQYFHALSIMYTGSIDGVRDMKKQLDNFNSELRKPYDNRNFDLIITKIHKLPYEAFIAVNSIFNIIYDFEGNIINDLSDTSKDVAPVFLNIFPQNGETFILLSCCSNDFTKYKTIFSRINRFTQKEIEDFFSNLIVTHCENFFISHEKWKRQPKGKRREFVSMFTETMFHRNDPKYLLNNSPIDLFDICKN